MKGFLHLYPKLLKSSKFFERNMTGGPSEAARTEDTIDHLGRNTHDAYFFISGKYIVWTNKFIKVLRFNPTMFRQIFIEN